MSLVVHLLGVVSSDLELLLFVGTEHALLLLVLDVHVDSLHLIALLVHLHQGAQVLGLVVVGPSDGALLPLVEDALGRVEGHLSNMGEDVVWELRRLGRLLRRLLRRSGSRHRRWGWSGGLGRLCGGRRVVVLRLGLRLDGDTSGSALVGCCSRLLLLLLLLLWLWLRLGRLGRLHWSGWLRGLALLLLLGCLLLLGLLLLLLLLDLHPPLLKLVEQHFGKILYLLLGILMLGRFFGMRLVVIPQLTEAPLIFSLLFIVENREVSHHLGSVHGRLSRTRHGLASHGVWLARLALVIHCYGFGCGCGCGHGRSHGRSHARDLEIGGFVGGFVGAPRLRFSTEERLEQNWNKIGTKLPVIPQALTTVDARRSSCVLNRKKKKEKADGDGRGRKG